MKKIWNKNYILLLQGQLVSSFGDALYTIALAFFVLKLTGSSTLIGTIMGIITIPRILLGPVAGVAADRCSKKAIIVLADLIRGIAVTAVAVLAYCGRLRVWELLAAAVIGGICAAFFNPSMETVMPVIVDEDHLVRANSIFDMLTSGADIIGQTAGGILYGILGGPAIFLFNGISYLFPPERKLLLISPAKEVTEMKKRA